MRRCASLLTLRFSPLCGCLEQGLLGDKLLQKLGSFNLERPRGRGLGRLFLLIVVHSPLYLSPLSPLLCFSPSHFPAFFLRLSIFSALCSTASFQDPLPYATHSQPSQGEKGLNVQGTRARWASGRVEPWAVT